MEEASVKIFPSMYQIISLLITGIPASLIWNIEIAAILVFTLLLASIGTNSISSIIYSLKFRSIYEIFSNISLILIYIVASTSVIHYYDVGLVSVIGVSVFNLFVSALLGLIASVSYIDNMEE